MRLSVSARHPGERIWRPEPREEQRLEVLNVRPDAFGFVTVGPSVDDVLGVARVETIPLLVTEDFEVQRAEGVEVPFDERMLPLGRRGGVAGFSAGERATTVLVVTDRREVAAAARRVWRLLMVELLD